MKKLVLIGILLLSLIKVSGQTTIKSIKLDSLIFDEINVYRRSLGVPVVKTFDIGELRQLSYILTDLNTSQPIIDHTRDPHRRFVGYNSECIYSYQIQSNTNSLTDNVLTGPDLENLAKITVQAWINSPNHNYLIASASVDRSTITSTITIQGRSLRLVVSYHDIIKFN
jgi:hypothetical protein